MTRPVIQVAAGIIAMLVGAWLIGWWAVGVILVAFGLLAVADALLRDDTDIRDAKRQFQDDVMERWRRAR